MSKSEILNYDPLLRPFGEDGELEELQEVDIYASDGTPVKKLYIPTSELTNKTPEEVGRNILSVFLAFNIDVSGETLDSIQDAEKIAGLADDLARHIARIFVVNLIIVYKHRLERGDGDDPEIKLRDDTEETDFAAFHRITGNLGQKWINNITNMFINHPEQVTPIWQSILRNILGKINLLIHIKKGDDYEVTRREYDDYIDRYWREFYDSTLKTLANRWASLFLQQLNIAGMPFPDLKRIVRGGLEVPLNIPGENLDGLVKWLKGQQNIICKIGDAKIILELPQDSGFSQDIGIKLLSERAKKGRPADPDRKRKLREFVELTHKRKYIAECLAEFAEKNSNGDWRKMIEFDGEFQEHCREYEAKMHDRAIIMETIEVLFNYQNDIRLMTKNKTKWERATSPLGVAQIIASLELNLRDEGGSPRDITTLSSWYTEGGGNKWKWKLKNNTDC